MTKASNWRGDEVREVECGEFFFAFGHEFLRACEEGITVRAGDPLDTFLLADLVKLPLGAAFGIADEDALDALRTRLGDLPAHRRCDFLRIDVPDCGQTFELEVIKPIGLFDRQHFARDGAAGDDAESVSGFGRGVVHEWSRDSIHPI
jgi:hypothetical protein